MLYQALAGLLVAIFGLLCLLHVYWGTGGTWALDGVLPTGGGGSGDRPVFTPGPVSTLAVAVLMAAAAAVVAWRAGFAAPDLPPWIPRLGTWALALVFGLRAVGEFRYVGFFKRVRGTLFARRDTWIYSPLCTLVAALALAVGVLAP